MEPRTLAVATAPKRNSFHWEQGTTTWDEIKAWMESPGTKKEAGNYILGSLEETTVAHDRTKPDKRCRNLHRNKKALVTRSAITLDIDSPDKGFADAVQLTLPYQAILHTTFSSAPDDPRYRLIVATDRDLLPDEYIVAASTIMQMLGEHQFDHGSSEPERYMFRPAATEPDWYHYWCLDGDPASVDQLLEDFEEDLSSLPIPTPHKNKRNPFEIPGVVGAFNRAYEDWDLLIAEYDLPYERVSDDRYQLVGARSQAGMGPISGAEGFVYSHHSHDPAYGKTCSAFDLVRLHRFGTLDEDSKPQTPINKLPSNEAMLELATTDHRVTAQLVGADFDPMTDDHGNTAIDWKLGFQVHSRTGKLLDLVGNWDLIRENDAITSIIRYNELTMCHEASDDLPWRTVDDLNRTFKESDRLELFDYLEREYGIRPTRQRVDMLVEVAGTRNHFNPIREYLQSLKWDGTPRVEECLPGVKTTVYTRRVARMVMTAAVARMMDPGCKWDHTLVLYGEEGLGKSWWVDQIARGYSSSLGRIDNKDTLLVMQRSWIMTADEGHSLRKADSDAMKEFLTRTYDVFRLPYEKETQLHPRHSVIWSTTNDETFLRAQDGNRRFLIVHCEEKVDFDALTDEYIDQLWAEAVQMYHDGEPLFLGEEEAEKVAQERDRYVEEDTLIGVIHEFLEQRVPEDWEDMSPQSRIDWMHDRDAGFAPKGTEQITRVCSRQIWVEALEANRQPNRMDLLEIHNALKKIPGWFKSPEQKRIRGHGVQAVFERAEDLI